MRIMGYSACALLLVVALDVTHGFSGFPALNQIGAGGGGGRRHCLARAGLRMVGQGEGDDAGTKMSRRGLMTVVGGAIVATTSPKGAQAYCPPNCRPDENGASPPIEALSQPINLDKSNSGKTIDTRKPRRPADNRLYDDDSVDLSNAEVFDKTRETDRVFFELQIGDQTNTSRIEIALYGDIVPQTCENFKLLATGAKGYGYKDTEIFRVVSGLQISGGDVLNNVGRSGKSALNGDVFDPENYRLLHTVPYIVSMTNTLEKQVDSRFFISTRPEVDPGYSKIFDGKYVAFGRIVKGVEAVKALDQIEVKGGKGINSGRPKKRVVIKDCGIVPKPYS